MTTSGAGAGVVIVSYRRHRWLRPALESVAGQAERVVLVDNGDDAAWAAAEAARVGATLVRPGGNVGFPAGVNAGVAALGTDLVALLNDDAFAGPGWLAAAGAVLADPTVGAVVPKLLFAWPYAEVRFDDDPWQALPDHRWLGRQIETATVAGEDVLAGLAGPGVHRLEEDGGRRWRWSSGRTPFRVPLPDGAGPDDIRLNGEPVEATRVVDLVNNAGTYLSAEGHGGDYGFQAPDGPAFAEPRDCFGGCGAALVTTADTWRRVGPLAASFFAYYEDTDWCWRAQLAGLRLRYDPSVTARHVGGASTGGLFDERVRFLAARNRLHTLARNAPLPLVRWQWRRAKEPGGPPGLRRAAATVVPRGLLERRRLSRSWQRSPQEVFDTWAGVGETWPGSAEGSL